MSKALAVAIISAMATACATTASQDRMVVEGYLSQGPTLRLYPTAISRQERSNSDCFQVIRPEADQGLAVPEGRVRVVGKAGLFDGDVMRLQVGQDIAHHELCDSRYIIWARIQPISGN